MKKVTFLLCSLLFSGYLLGQSPVDHSEICKEKIKILETLLNGRIEVLPLRRANYKSEVVTVSVPDRLLERNQKSRRRILDAFVYTYVNFIYNKPQIVIDTLYVGLCAKSDSLNPLEASASYVPSFTSIKDRLLTLSGSLIELSPFYQDVFMQDDELVIRFKYSGALNAAGKDYINDYSLNFGGIIGKYFLNEQDKCNRILILWEGSNGEMSILTLFPHDRSFKKDFRDF